MFFFDMVLKSNSSVVEVMALFSFCIIWMFSVIKIKTKREDGRLNLSVQEAHSFSLKTPIPSLLDATTFRCCMLQLSRCSPFFNNLDHQALRPMTEC